MSGKHLVALYNKLCQTENVPHAWNNGTIAKTHLMGGPTNCDNLKDVRHLLLSVNPCFVLLLNGRVVIKWSCGKQKSKKTKEEGRTQKKKESMYENIIKRKLCDEPQRLIKNIEKQYILDDEYLKENCNVILDVMIAILKFWHLKVIKTFFLSY